MEIEEEAMIRISNEEEYDCVLADFEDEKSRTSIHFHSHAGTRDTGSRELRQVIVESQELGTVLNFDMVPENGRLLCDPRHRTQDGGQ